MHELIEVFPDISTARKLSLTMPITSCEAERYFSKLAFIKNKFRSTMTEDRLNFLSILSIENYIARKLSYDNRVHEYVAREHRKKYFVKCVLCKLYGIVIRRYE